MSSSSSTILAVDDRIDNLFVLKEVFAQFLPSCTLLTATSAEEGLAIASSQSLKGAILDVQMPGMDGIEMCRRLKRNPATRDTPVILLTGHECDSRLRVEGLEAGAEDFLGKPIENTEFVARVRVMLRMKGAEDSLLELNARLESLVQERTDALRRSEEKYRVLFKNLQDVFLRTDLQGRITMASPSLEQLSGYRIGQVLGMRYADYFVERDQHQLFNEEVLAKGHVEGFEFQFRREDDVSIWVSANAHVVRDDSGRVLGVEGLFRDITARKEAEAERERLQSRLLQTQRLEAVGQLAGGVAHDFNNLLMVIMNAVEFVKGELPSESPMLEDLDEILGAARRGAGLVNQLLAFSRQQMVVSEVLDLKRSLASVQEILPRVLGEDIVLQLDMAEPLGRIKADPAQMQQLILNLAMNSRDAMPKGGTVRLEARNVDLDASAGKQLLDAPEFSPGPFVKLSFSDTGVGMSQDVCDRIFEPFYTTKGLANASGLGLAAIYGITKQHNGFLAVESEPGIGTTIDLFLPRLAEPAPARSPSGSGRGMPRGTETVLVLEDEAAVRFIVVRTLGHLGYRVLEASDGEEAMRLALDETSPVDLLVTDVVMPGMDGKSVADQMRAVRPELKVIFMSGYDEERLARHGVSEGNEILMRKPFNREVLAHTVRDVFDSVLLPS